MTFDNTNGIDRIQAMANANLACIAVSHNLVRHPAVIPYASVHILSVFYPRASYQTMGLHLTLQAHSVGASIC